MNFAWYPDYICPTPALGAPLSSIIFEDIDALDVLWLLLLLVLLLLLNKLKHNSKLLYMNRFCNKNSHLNWLIFLFTLFLKVQHSGCFNSIFRELTWPLTRWPDHVIEYATCSARWRHDGIYWPWYFSRQCYSWPTSTIKATSCIGTMRVWITSRTVHVTDGRTDTTVGWSWSRSRLKPALWRTSSKGRSQFVTIQPPLWQMSNRTRK